MSRITNGRVTELERLYGCPARNLATMIKAIEREQRRIEKLPAEQQELAWGRALTQYSDADLRVLVDAFQNEGAGVSDG